MRTMLIAAVVLAACSGPADDVAEGPDAAPVSVDASEDRIAGCTHACASDAPAGQLCPGWQSDTAPPTCIEECIAGVARRSWCP